MYNIAMEHLNSQYKSGYSGESRVRVANTAKYHEVVSPYMIDVVDTAICNSYNLPVIEIRILPKCARQRGTYHYSGYITLNEPCELGTLVHELAHYVNHKVNHSRGHDVNFARTLQELLEAWGM